MYRIQWPDGEDPPIPGASGSRFIFGDQVYSSYDIGSWKPEPGLFLYAASKMGVAPTDCVVVEDSVVGITAALAAGMNAICYDPMDRSNTSEGVTIIHELCDLLPLLPSHAAS